MADRIITEIETVLTPSLPIDGTLVGVGVELMVVVEGTAGVMEAAR